MKNLKQFIIVSAFVFLTGTIFLVQANVSVRVEPVNGESIPVSINSTVMYETYDSEKFIHNIDFSLTNKSEMYVGRVSFIQYELNKKNKEITTTFWSDYDGFQPLETRNLSISIEYLGTNSARLIWVAHRICTDKGTWEIDLTELRKAIFPYKDGKIIILPKAEFFSQQKCLPD